MTSYIFQFAQGKKNYHFIFVKSYCDLNEFFIPSFISFTKINASMLVRKSPLVFTIFLN